MADYTIKDMLEAAGVKPNQASWKRLVEAGFNLDEPVSALQEPQTKHARLQKLAEVGAAEGDYKNWLKGQNAINVDAGLTGKEPMPNIFGAKGIARSLKLPGSQQARRTRKIKVPEAKFSLKELTKAIAQVEDPNIRAGLAFNALVPLRPIEVAKLRIDDIDFETGGFSYTDDRGTKVRAKLDLPEMALGILEEQANKARAIGSETLFYDSNTKLKDPAAKFRQQMTDEVKAPGGIRDIFAQYEKQMGRKIRGVSDFRKIVPSIIANELGYKDVVSKILGHSSLDAIAGEMEKVTGASYVGEVFSVDGRNTTRTFDALRAIQNGYARSLELPTVNALAGAMNLNVPSLTTEGAPLINVVEHGESTSPQNTVKGEVTPEVRASIEEQQKAANAEAQARAAKAEQEALTAKIAKAEEMAKPETQEKLKAGMRAEAEMKQIEKNLKAEVADEMKPKVEIDSDTKSKMSGLADFLDSIGKGFKVVAPALPGVGLYYSGKAKAEEAEKLIEQGSSPIGAYVSKAAEFAYEEFTVPGGAAAITESLGEVQPATAEEATTDPTSFTESEMGIIQKSQSTPEEDAQKLQNFLEQDLNQP
jgi:integrase